MAFGTENIIDWLVRRTIKKAGRVSFETWQPGKKLKLLSVGYSGGRNTGSEVRNWSMVNQFYHILGKNNTEIGVLTLEPKNSTDYFQPPTNLIPFGTMFFNPFLKAGSEYHLGVVSEGSTLKSNWSDLLTLLFVCACGIFKEQGKPSIAYGSGAGEMDDYLREIVPKFWDETYVITRDQPSLDIIRGIGLEGELGTDTAWIFPPASREWAEKELREKAGWDGKKPIIGLAVINPFCWPVYLSLIKWLTGYGRLHPDRQYATAKMAFFTWSEEREKKFNDYLSSIARATDEFAQRHDVCVIVLGMESLDWYAINRIQKMLKTPAQIFSSRFYNGFQMVALLRTLAMLVTSRYHARVLSMPGGVPSIAVSWDERLYNLLQESGHLDDYYFRTDEPELAEKLSLAMEKMWENREKVREEILQIMPKYLKMMAEMGKTFRNFVRGKFPQFPLPPEPKDWLGYLPKLHPELDRIVKERVTRH